MLSSDNINIQARDVLSSPGMIRSELPLSIESVRHVLKSRQEIQEIFDLRQEFNIYAVRAHNMDPEIIGKIQMNFLFPVKMQHITR